MFQVSLENAKISIELRHRQCFALCSDARNNFGRFPLYIDSVSLKLQTKLGASAMI